VKTASKEYTLSLPADSTEYEIQDLSPETEYEFRLRLENTSGCGRDATAVCRTNAICPAPGSLACSNLGTAQVELKWLRPTRLGNETTKDAYQVSPEAIECYQATLGVEDDDKDQASEKGSLRRSSTKQVKPGEAPGLERPCCWKPDSWREDKAGNIASKLTGLRPDTKYALDSFCAVNSMGPGAFARPLVFWTLPVTPRIVGIRVRRGLVLVALAEVGGMCVKDFSVIVLKQGQPEDQAVHLKVTRADLMASQENDGECDAQSATDLADCSELPLKFQAMPAAEINESHFIRMRVANAGGWSEWTPMFQTTSIARQQGADLAETNLKAAIETPKIDHLTQVLEDIKGIEFQDYRYVNEATTLLQRLRETKAVLLEAMKLRDPVKLQASLELSREVRLPGLMKAETLLKKLTDVVHYLNTAKGINQLREALKAGVEAKLPAGILQVAADRLQTREAAQKGLEEAMEAAVVPGMEQALAVSVGMNLPSEEKAQQMLAFLRIAEEALHKAVDSSIIIDLTRALDLVTQSGLREVNLIAQAKSLLEKLFRRRDVIKKEVQMAMASHHPSKMRSAITTARLAQVDQDIIQEALTLRKKIEDLLKAVKDASGTEQRKATLQEATTAQAPHELLELAEAQLESLELLCSALKEGDPEVLRQCLRAGESCGLKEGELLEARLVYRDWGAAYQMVEAATSVKNIDLLRKALAAARHVGINEAKLASANVALLGIDIQNTAERNLKQALSSRRIELIGKMLKVACDAGVSDIPLITKAKELLARLQGLRVDLSVALESAELRNLHRSLAAAQTPPGLPEEEVRAARDLLNDLQEEELDAILTNLQKAEQAQDFRGGTALLARWQRARAGGVEVDPDVVCLAEEWINEAQAEQRKRRYNDIQGEREETGPPPWPEQGPETIESVPLPMGAVSGELQVEFSPAGTAICIIPREIVEATININLKNHGSGESDVKIPGVLRALELMLAPEDSVRCLGDASMLKGEDGRGHRKCSIGHVAGRLEMPVALYIRAPHPGITVAEAICMRGRLSSDVWNSPHVTDPNSPPPSPPASPRGTQQVVQEPTQEDLVETLSKSLCDQLTSRVLAGGSRICMPRQMTDYVRDVRHRVFRTLRIELAWTYPKGIFDSLEVTCILFDKEHVVEILDAKGFQGSYYGLVKQNQYVGSLTKLDMNVAMKRTSTGVGKDNRKKDCQTNPFQAVAKYVGDVKDGDKRTGKQVMELRLDLMPAGITDIIFVVSPSNSRDLSKFASLKSSVYDAETMTLFASHGVANSGDADQEAAIMTGVWFSPKDRLWRVSNYGVFTQGGHRDYRPVLSKILELGYPRNAGMRNLVRPLLDRFQRELQLPRPVKACTLQVGDNSKLSLNYAIELLDDVPEWAQLVQQISQTRAFTKVIAKALKQGCGRRFSEKDLTISVPVFKSLKHQIFNLSWQYPHLKSGTASQAMTHTMRHERSDVTHEKLLADDLGGYYMDASCIMFSGQALREVVDYRGSHGVRIVHNGVVDYRGYWIGPMAVGDASGGSVMYVGEEMDDLNRAGKQSIMVQFENIPEGVTECFFTLSCPTRQRLSSFEGVNFDVRDSNDPHHQVECGELPSTHRPPSHQALVQCCISRTGPESWSVETLNASSKGSAVDYREIINCLRAGQAARHANRPLVWPSRTFASDEDVLSKKMAVPLPRLTVWGYHRQSSNVSEVRPLSPQRALSERRMTNLSDSSCPSADRLEALTARRMSSARFSFSEPSNSSSLRTPTPTRGLFELSPDFSVNSRSWSGAFGRTPFYGTPTALLRVDERRPSNDDDPLLSRFPQTFQSQPIILKERRRPSKER